MGSDERELSPEEQKCVQIANEVAESIPGFERRVENCMYRADYQDFVLLLTDDYYCTMRKRLVDIYDEDKVGDVRREIENILKRAEPYQDYDGEEVKEEKDQEI